MGIIYLVLAFCLNAGANVLMKLAAQKGAQFHSLNPLVLVRENYLLILALVAFGLNFACYFMALRQITLSVAYPIMNVMSIVIIYAFAVWYFHDNINIWQTVGYGFLLFGMGLIFYFSNQR